MKYNITLHLGKDNLTIGTIDDAVMEKVKKVLESEEPGFFEFSGDMSGPKAIIVPYAVIRLSFMEIQEVE